MAFDHDILSLAMRVMEEMRPACPDPLVVSARFDARGQDRLLRMRRFTGSERDALHFGLHVLRQLSLVLETAPTIEQAEEWRRINSFLMEMRQLMRPRHKRRDTTLIKTPISDEARTLFNLLVPHYDSHTDLVLTAFGLVYGLSGTTKKEREIRCKSRELVWLAFIVPRERKEVHERSNETATVR